MTAADGRSYQAIPSTIKMKKTTGRKRTNSPGTDENNGKESKVSNISGGFWGKMREKPSKYYKKMAEKIKEKITKFKELFDRSSVFALLALFISIASTIVGLLQWFSMSAQQAIMQRQLDQSVTQNNFTKIQLRPNLRQLDASITPFNEAGKLKGWYISPRWINSGNTEAINLRSAFYKRGYPPWDHKSTNCPPEKYDLSVPMTVTAGSSFTELAAFIPVEEAIEANENRTAIVMGGRIEYSDIFGSNQVHRQTWCVIAIPNDLESGKFSFISLQPAQ